MLLGNRTVLSKSLATFRNGTSVAGAYAGQTINNLTQNGRNRNIFVNSVTQTISRATGVPIGYSHPYSWVMPQTQGGLASLGRAQSSGSVSASLNLGLQVDASLSAAGLITNADMAIIIGLVADLAASGSITDANMSIVANMIADLAASGSITDASLSVIIGMIANLSSAASLTSANLTTTLGMSASITSATELSPDSLSAALLNAVLAEYNITGTVGEALNNVGASGNPWSTALSGNNAAGSFGEKIQKLLEKTTYIGTK